MTVVGKRLDTLERLVVAATFALQGAQDELCRLDSSSGDRDEEFSVATAARRIREQLSRCPPDDVSGLVDLVAAQFASVGGTMGAVCYVLVHAMGDTIKGVTESLTPGTIVALLEQSEKAVTTLGGAKRGDNSVVDAISGARNAAEECSRQGRSPVETLMEVAAPHGKLRGRLPVWLRGLAVRAASASGAGELSIQEPSRLPSGSVRLPSHTAPRCPGV